MNWPLLGAAGLLIAADWVVVWRCAWRADYFFKPAALLGLIAWFCVTTRLAYPSGWFLAGLLLSLLGDILLMLPKNLFLPGLVAFLCGHLCYVVGFNLSVPALSWRVIPTLIVILIAAIWLYRRVLSGLKRRGSGPVLQNGVRVYSVGLTLMALSASLTLLRPEWSLQPAIIATLGGLLFFASDAMLALDRFVAPIPHGRRFIRITYHLGQLGLLLGLTTHLA